MYFPILFHVTQAWIGETDSQTAREVIAATASLHRLFSLMSATIVIDETTGPLYDGWHLFATIMSDSRSQFDADVADPALDRDTRFDILSHQHRRALITLLAETPRQTRAELTTQLAAAITDIASQPAAEDRRQLRIALHHNHLPKLADANLIEYEDDTVTATPTLIAVADSMPDI